eukprot:SAG22_NODE_288_length_12949_cov_163.316265_13_plen_86_part_00
MMCIPAHIVPMCLLYVRRAPYRAVCRTCSTFSDMGGHCAGLDQYPNATVAEHGDIKGADDMAKEIMTRGPIACGAPPKMCSLVFS